MQEFYVYLIRDQRPLKFNEPIYVGKGKNNRAFTHLMRSSNPILRRKIEKSLTMGITPQIEIIEWFANEPEAFKFEKELIKLYGRIDIKTGTLCNLTDGGEGSSGSLACSENLKRLNKDPKFAEARDKRAAELMTRLNQDPIFCKNRSEAAKRTQARPDFIVRRNAVWFKMLEDAGPRAKARWQNDPITRQKILDALERGRNNPEAKKRKSIIQKQRNADPEYQAKCTLARKNKMETDPEFAANHSKHSSNNMTKWHAKRKFLEQEIGIPFNERWNPPHGRY